MARPRPSAEQQFSSSWQKAVAWAGSQGISADSYLPVYQMDLSRLQNGQFSMSAGERNRAILAASRPTTVTPAPTPSWGPAPTTVLHNMLNTARNLFTGLIHLPQELWHSADATFHAIANPASMARGPTGRPVGVGATIGNWLNDTLLAYLPYTSDIGTILQHGLKGGFETLAEHPLTAFLDLIPGSEGGILGRLGRAGSISADAADAGRSSLIGKMGNLLSAATVGQHPGVTMRGQATQRLTVVQRVENLMAGSGHGVGPALSALGETMQNLSVLGQNLFSWLFDGPGRAWSNLSDREKLQVRELLDTRHADGGNRLLDALNSPDLSAGVRDTLHQFLDGPLTFATEEDLFAGQGLTAIDTPSGKRGFWTGPRLEKIESARRERERTERKASEELVGLQHHKDILDGLDAMLARATQTFQSSLQQARTAVAKDAGLLDNVTQELERPTRFRQRRGISKSAQVRAVVGAGGLADEFIREIQKAKRNPAQIGELARAMKHRLSKWGPKSVNAADNPGLAMLASTVDAFTQWADAYRAESKAIDEGIFGEAAAAKHMMASEDVQAEARRKVLQDRQETERQNLRDTRDRARAQARGNFAHRQRELTSTRVYLDKVYLQEFETKGEYATATAVNRLWRETKRKRDQLAKDYKAQLVAERKEYLARDKQAQLIWQRDQARLARKHLEEKATLAKGRRETRAAMGDVVKELDGWSKAVKGFREAVADNPADKFRNAFVTLYEKHLLQQLRTAELIDATRSFAERETPGKWDELTHSEAHLGEYLHFRFDDIYGDPRLGPEVKAEAEEASRLAWESANEELKTLIAQGFDVPYIPASMASDVRMGRNAIKPLIGRGIPRTDMSKARIWDLTPETGDFALGISKAVVQALQRDATIELMEHYIKPMAMTGAQLREFIAKVKGPLIPNEVGDISQRALTVAAEELGFRSIKPKDLFQFTLPRWGDQEIWLPKGIAGALKELSSERQKFTRLKKVTKVYRYSILGLSPRFDAHILFGGTVMAGFRVSPHALFMIGNAYRALRDGTIPEIPGHASIEEGFDTTVIRMFHGQGGEQMLKMTLHENIEQKQGIARAAVKPIHIAKAIADVNFNFTRYVRAMQVATVYLDGAAKATRRDARLHLPTADGRDTVLSAERAMEQGMRAVERVYGSLGAMSPLERQVAQSIIPFYGWQKHVMKYVLSFPLDHPWRALVLSQAATRASESVPASWPIRLQLLFFLGSPTKTGAVTAIDIRSLDPFRTTANYFTLQGWMQALNPVLLAGPAMLDPQFVYGSNVLYPKLTYTAFYGTEIAGAQGNVVTGLSQVVPQLSAATSALSGLTQVRSLWQTDRPAAIKQLLNNLNIPFVTPPVNLKQVSAHTEIARYETAKAAATHAFRTGDFSAIQHYKTVPNPLNPDYTISPAALEALYNAAKAQQPNVAPIESVLPPPTPYGF